MLRMIREEEPPRPSTRLSDSGEALASISAQRHMEPAKLTKLVRGELDWIVMKALEKDRNRRYETANGLRRRRPALPERRAGAGVSAVGGYRFRKFVRRNKGVLATASWSCWRWCSAQPSACGRRSERLMRKGWPRSGWKRPGQLSDGRSAAAAAEASEREARMKEGWRKTPRNSPSKASRTPWPPWT